MSKYNPYPNPSEGWIIVEQESDESEERELYLYDAVYDKKVYIADFDDQVSGHEWTNRPGEIIDPVVNLTDRLTEEERLGFRFEMVYLSRDETICKCCHMVSPRMYNDCQSCGTTLELNVR